MLKLFSCDFISFQTFKKASKIDTEQLTEYDIHSIMHYDGTLRGRVTQPIMTDKITGKGIDVNKEMSPLDIKKLNKLYPCQPTSRGCGEY